MIVRGRTKSRMSSVLSHATNWFQSHKTGFIIALIDPPLTLLFLLIWHWFSPKNNPPLFDFPLSLEIVAICLTAASASGLALMIRLPFRKGSSSPSLGLNVRAPTLPHRSHPPGILELLAPFLKTSMWESQELAMVMHKSYELMKKHVAFIRTLTWTQRYTARPSNFMMSEAISLILKLLPPVETHSAICSGCK